VSQGWEKGMNGLETKNEKGREAGNILNGLNNLVKDPYGGLNEWKAVHKKKIIACMPMPPGPFR
jgi:hypothetical protein